MPGGAWVLSAYFQYQLVKCSVPWYSLVCLVCLVCRGALTTASSSVLQQQQTVVSAVAPSILVHAKA